MCDTTCTYTPSGDVAPLLLHYTLYSPASFFCQEWAQGISSTPPCAARDLLFFVTMLSSWYVLSMVTSRLSFHFKDRMPSSLLLITSPRCSLASRTVGGIPLLSLRATSPKPSLLQLAEKCRATVKVVSDDNVALPLKPLVFH